MLLLIHTRRQVRTQRNQPSAFQCRISLATGNRNGRNPPPEDGAERSPHVLTKVADSRTVEHDFPEPLKRKAIRELRMRRRIRFCRWSRQLCLAIVALGLMSGIVGATDLRIATWNLEHLNDAHGEGCIERTEDDFDEIARRIAAINADIVAFQEVENEAAARRVFDTGRWKIVMSSRPHTRERRRCRDRPEGRLQRQATGIAVRKDISFQRGTDLASLALGDPHLRWGTHIVVGQGERKLHVLSVHLRTGCWGAREDAKGRTACAVLRHQFRVLRAWIDERRRAGNRFAIAGDFNRRLAIAGDWAWALLSSDDLPLELATAGIPSKCDSRYPDFIDHIVLGGPSGLIGEENTFREEAREGPHPDHCALSIAIGDGLSGGAATRGAFGIRTGAFARMNADQIVGSIKQRLIRDGAPARTRESRNPAVTDRPPGSSMPWPGPRFGTL